jgi:hypothetical protein
MQIVQFLPTFLFSKNISSRTLWLCLESSLPSKGGFSLTIFTSIMLFFPLLHLEDYVDFLAPIDA